MEDLNSQIESHYYKADIFEDILKRLKDKGVDLNNVSRNDITGVDEFHVRGAQVSKEIAKEIHLTNSTVLDVGCGIGGPCRMLADEFNCIATGLDLSHEYIRTATKLSELVGLGNKTSFVQGSALDLPFKDDSFDIVWTQHVQMNINDKIKFYSEINRVLHEKGIFLYYDVFSKSDADVDYPVPWADDASLNFLETSSNMDGILLDLGFTKFQTKEQTNIAIHFLNKLFEKIKSSGLAKLGLDVLMGDTTKKKLDNIMRGLEEGKIELQSGIYKK